MSKEKAVLVDHSFHRLTGSTLFLKEWLSGEFDLAEVYDDSWRGGAKPGIAALARRGYGTFFFIQYLPSPAELKEIAHCRIVWFPMEGILSGRHRLKLLGLREIPLKVVCFCRETHECLTRYGFDSFHVQFFFSPGGLPRKAGYRSPPRVMFWQRNRDINWSKVKTVLGAGFKGEIMLRPAPDPGQETVRPAGEDMAGFPVRVADDCRTREEYLERLAVCDIFFAPRRMEGIGKSFLEAMAMGLCVVAPDGPTMNEYIRRGVNGFLYDPDAPKEIDLSNYQLAGRAAQEDAAEGYRRMEARRPELLEFLKNGCRRSRSRHLREAFLLRFDFLREILARGPGGWRRSSE